MLYGSFKDFTYNVVSDQIESKGRDVETICDEVHNAPHVADETLQPFVPETFHLSPNEP